MSFAFDDGSTRPDISPRSASVEPGQTIRITDSTRCTAEYRKIRANIEAHEDPDDLQEYWHRESLMLDAIHLFDSYVSSELEQAFHDHLAVLKDGLASMARHSA